MSSRRSRRRTPRPGPDDSKLFHAVYFIKNWRELLAVWTLQGLWRARFWFLRGAALIVAWGLTGRREWVLVLIVAVWLLWRMLRWKRASGGAAGARGGQGGISKKKALATLEAQWPVACTKANLTGSISKVPPGLEAVTWHGDGKVTATVSSRTGVMLEDLEKQTLVLRRVIGCREVLVSELKSNSTRLTFNWLDPMERPITLADLAEIPDDPPDRRTFGVTQFGTPATMPPAGLSSFHCGMSGHGKSNNVHAALCSGLVKRIPTRVYIADPKGGMELREYGLHVGESNGFFEVRGYATTVAAAEKMFESVEQAMYKRMQSLAERGVRKWEPTLDDPNVVVIVDEALRFSNLLKKGSDSALGQISSQGRSAGYEEWVVAQIGHADTIGRLRELLPYRYSVATRTPQQTDAILGMGAAALGADCHRLAGTPGVGYMFGEEDGRPVKWRSAYVSDEDIQFIAAGKVPPAVEKATRPRLLVVPEQHRKRVLRPQWWWLYWWYDADGNLLYIGKTNRLGRRAYEHQEQPWWPRADHMKSRRFRTEGLVLAAEEAAIKSEAPLFNKVHNGGPRELTA